MTQKTSLERLAAHVERNPNDLSALKVLARKFGIGAKRLHVLGFYWKERRA